MMKRVEVWSRAIVMVAALAASASAAARDPFQFTAIIAGVENPTLGFIAVEDAIDNLRADELRRRGFNYAPGADINVLFDFRGLGVMLAFPSGDDRLTFNVPSIGLTEIVDLTPAADGSDAARKAALDELKDRLQEKPEFLKQLLTALTRFSPIDPIAGNPNSLFSKFQERDFTTGFTHKVSQIYGCGTSAFNFTNDAPIQVAVVGGASDIFAEAQARAAALQAENEFGIGAQLMSTNAGLPGGDFRSTTLSVPLSYTWKFDFNPRHKLRFDLPLTATDSEGAASYSLGMGLAYTIPVSEDWTLTPAAGAGATGSEDLGSAGGVSAYSLTSAYTWRLGGFALAMGNSVGQYDSLALKIGDVEAEADISNTVYTNGLLLSGPNSLIARNLVVEYSIIDTRISGDAVYAEYYDEIGIAFGRVSTQQGIITGYLKAGLSYLIGDNEIDGLKINLSARF